MKKIDTYLCRGYIQQVSFALLAEDLTPSLIYIGQRADLIVHQNCEAFQCLEDISKGMVNDGGKCI